MKKEKPGIKNTFPLNIWGHFVPRQAEIHDVVGRGLVDGIAAGVITTTVLYPDALPTGFSLTVLSSAGICHFLIRKNTSKNQS